MRKSNTTVFLVIILVLVLILILSSGFFIVDEREQVVITRFGEPVRTIKDAGLNFKIPFIQDVNRFEKRILEWDGNPAEILAKDKKFILVDTYARWRIADPLKFFRSVVNENGAQNRLDNIIESATRNLITGTVLIDVVRNSNRKLEHAELELDVETDTNIDSIQVGRDKLAKGILEAATEKVSEYGIELIDVQIKRINYIEDVRKKVFERMIAERMRIAEKYRSEGMGKKAEIEGKMEKDLQEITSEAYRKAQEIKGKADAEAIRIYASAYEKDPDFYSFTKSLDSYRNSLNEKSWIILSTDSDYLKYLKNINAK